MANFKEVVVGEGITYIKPKDLADAGITGVILEGEFMEKLLNPKYNSISYKFSTADGIKVINSTGTLTARMELVQPGTLCQVVYNGKAVIESGDHKGTEAHQFNVLVEDGE